MDNFSTNPQRSQVNVRTAPVESGSARLLHLGVHPARCLGMCHTSDPSAEMAAKSPGTGHQLCRPSAGAGTAMAQVEELCGLIPTVNRKVAAMSKLTSMGAQRLRSIAPLRVPVCKVTQVRNQSSLLLRLSPLLVAVSGSIRNPFARL
jgi:hypothetical protein